MPTFEGWLKVELVDALVRNGYDAVPEKDTIDIVCGDAAIELKTANTNYACAGAVAKTKPITKNVESIIADIRKLQGRDYRLKAVILHGRKNTCQEYQSTFHSWNTGK